MGISPGDCTRHLPATLTGLLALLDSPLSETIEQALRDARKICSLYTHQVAAINALARGKNVIVSTSTASGKSVIYQVRKKTSLFAGVNALCLGTCAKIPGGKRRRHGNVYLPDKGANLLYYVARRSLPSLQPGPCAGSKKRPSGVASLLSRS